MSLYNLGLLYVAKGVKMRTGLEIENRIADGQYIVKEGVGGFNKYGKRITKEYLDNVKGQIEALKWVLDEI